jgi:hypothetical protein
MKLTATMQVSVDGAVQGALGLAESRAFPKGITIQVYRQPPARSM